MMSEPSSKKARSDKHEDKDKRHKDKKQKDSKAPPTVTITTPSKTVGIFCFAFGSVSS